tara:strand:+ start:1752 stop:2234 length:483 start_codon:yes stop_codon:yes gene_type:complete
MASTKIITMPVMPNLVIWDNGSSGVAFMGKEESGPISYKYLNKTKKISNVFVVEYQPGSHAKMLNNLVNNNGNDKAIFIKKIGDEWYLLGIIEDTSKLENGNYKFVIKRYNENQKPRYKTLSTNKRDALAILNLQKQIGKGTGNLNWGVCRTKPLNKRIM